ncbi:MAG: MFS transporter [Calditrichia bacterium]
MSDQMTNRLKESAVIRWSTLMLISVVMFASYYFYDVFSAIKQVLQQELGFTNAEYGMMVGYYSFTNFFLGMTVFGGIILDKWGIRKTGIMFISFMTLGAFFTAYGASETFNNGGLGYGFLNSIITSYSPALKLMVLGRLLFGLGAETLYVVINKIMVKWFKNKELALAFGINLAIARFGTAAALIFSPKIVNWSPDWSNAGWFGFMLMIIAFISFLFYMIMDRKFDTASGGKVELDPEDEFKFSDVVDLLKNRAFIYITMLCVTFYSAVFPFISYAPDFLHNKFGFSLEASGQIATILPYGTIIFTPLFGWVVDKKGKSASLMFIGSLLLIIVHFSLSLTSLTPYFAIFFLGVAFSLVPAAMWPAVAKIVEENKLGTAYGFMFFIQNFGLFLFPWLVGKVLDITNPGVTAEMVRTSDLTFDYTWAIFMLGVLGFLGLIFAYLLKRQDKINKLGLELPSNESH